MWAKVKEQQNKELVDIEHTYSDMKRNMLLENILTKEDTVLQT